MKLITKAGASDAEDTAFTSTSASAAEEHCGGKRQPSYGVLGNMIAKLMTKAFESSKVTAKCTATGYELPRLAGRQAPGDPGAKATPAAPVVKAPGMLRGVREFVKMLWSTFLPDPSFQRAIDALTLRDAGLGVDAAAGDGGYLTAE